jgi:uncharacterized protein YndB with AHSA1/START domain
MSASPTDRIEKTILLKAPPARVWRALTDPTEFGAWFGARLDGGFVVGRLTTGRITSPGYEHMRFEATVERMEPERLFAFRWHPHAVDPGKDYSSEPMTLVELRLEPVPDGTRLTVVESGFDRLPPARRDEAFPLNSEGWAIELQNVKRHVGG